MGWAILAIGGFALAAYLALQVAINRNGAAVLDTVDRLVGGTRDVAMVHAEQIGDHPDQKVRVYAPENESTEMSGETAARPVLFFVHGGSWRSGDPDDYNFIGRNLVPEGYVVVLGGYRIDAGGKFPGMLQDTAAAIAWTHANAAKFGGDPEQLFVAGHSAGAYNVVMNALDPQWLDQVGLAPDVITGVVGLAGPYDFLPFDTESTIAAFGDAPEPSLTQPIHFARGDAPPMLLMSGEKDTTVFPRNSRVLAAALEAAGGTAETAFYPDMNHQDILLALASPWRSRSDVVGRITDFTKRSGAEGEIAP